MTEHKTITEALAAFQADLPKVGKNSTNPHFNSKYADLADIVEVVLPKLAAQGMAWATEPTFTENGFVLVYELRHTSGDVIRGEWPLPDPASVNSQALGSAVTYGKRYALSAVTGIAPDVDDDGNAADKARSAPRQHASDKITAALTAINECDDPVKLDKIEDRAAQLGISGVAKVKAALTEKRAELGPSDVDHWTTAEVPA